MLGDHVGLLAHAVVDVSGDSKGGTALIGGDTHGANPDVRNAERTYVDADAIIRADALSLGNGGKTSSSYFFNEDNGQRIPRPEDAGDFHKALAVRNLSEMPFFSLLGDEGHTKKEQVVICHGQSIVDEISPLHKLTNRSVSANA